MNEREPIPAGLERLGQMAFVLGVLGVIGCVIAYMGNPAQFYQSYYFAFVFWVCMSFGCYGWMLFHNMVRSHWGVPVIRIWEAGAELLPFLLVAFVPILLGMHTLYPWARPTQVAADAVLQRKHAYMNPYWFGIRSVLYFAVCIFFTAFLTKWSRDQDRTGDPALEKARAAMAAPAFLIFVLTVTLAFTDWVMSVEAHWFSTVFGFLFVDLQGIEALTFAVMIVMLLAHQQPYAGLITRASTRDLGNLMLMMTMVWAWFELSQWLITWSGNLPEEITYYLDRLNGGWWAIGTAIVFGQFFIPFLLLLSNRVKRTPRFMFQVAEFMFLINLVNIYWTTIPSFRPGEKFAIVWTDLAPFLGIGGLWLALFVWRVRQHRLVPLQNPHMQEVSYEYEPKPSESSGA